MSTCPDSGKNGESPPVRTLFLCAGDPDNARAFSGSARSLWQALERLGCLHAKGNVNGLTDVFSPPHPLMRVWRRIDKLGIEDRYRWSSVAFHRNSVRARRIAADHPGYTTCLMYGTSYLPRLPVPTYCYFDATSVQVRRARAWEFARFSDGTANRIINYQRLVFNKCAAVFPRSQWAAQSVREDYGLPEDRICVAGAGPNHYVEPLPHKPYDGKTILFVGSEFERKGGPEIVAAFRQVRRSIADARLVIIGCSPAIDDPGIEVIGRISKDEPGGLDRIMTLYSEASVFCIMSRFEPFGIAVIEAQNAYVPCVVPARFAFTETVVDGVTGLHVEDYEPESIARALLRLLSDIPRLAVMGKAGHDYVRSTYTWDEAARRIASRMRDDLAAGIPRETGSPHTGAE